MTSRFRLFALTLPVLAVLIVASALVSGQAGSANGEWPHWGGDLGSTRYSPLDQINRDNVKNLRVAWRWKADNFGPRPQNNLRGHAADGRRRALHDRRHPASTSWPSTARPARRCGCIASTKATRGESRRAASRAASSTGPTARSERIVFITPGYHLISLDAKTGLPDPGVRQERRRRSVSGVRSAARRSDGRSARARRR